MNRIETSSAALLGAFILLNRAGTTSATRRQLLEVVPEMAESTLWTALDWLLREGALTELPVRGASQVRVFALSERSMAALGA